MTEIILRVARAGIADEEQKMVGVKVVDDILNASDKLGTIEKDIRIRFIDAVFDLIGSVAEIQGDSNSSRLQDAEIDRQSLQAVHQKDRDFLAFLNATGHQEIGNTVRLLVKDRPGDLAAVELAPCRLYELILLPCDSLALCYGRIDLHQGDIISVKLAVSL